MYLYVTLEIFTDVPVCSLLGILPTIDKISLTSNTELEECIHLFLEFLAVSLWIHCAQLVLVLTCIARFVECNKCFKLKKSFDNWANKLVFDDFVLSETRP